MDKVQIGNDLYFVEAPERFAWILEEKLGRDAAEYFKRTLEDANVKGNCGGECDETYRIQERFQRAIRDALEELEAAKVRKLGASWTSGKVDVEAFERVMKDLRNEL